MVGIDLTAFDYSTLSFNNWEYAHRIELSSHIVIEIHSKLIPDYENMPLSAKIGRASCRERV